MRHEFPIAPCLETLILDVPKGLYYFPWQHGAPLRSVSLNSCWSGVSSLPYGKLKSFTRLHELIIFHPVDSRLRETVRALKIPRVSIKYLEKADRESQNKSILSLSGSCLFRILDFLGIEDWVTMQDVHPRFSRLITACHTVHYEISRQSLEELPLHWNRPFYLRIGRIVKQLIVRDVESAIFFDIMHFFKELDTLELRDMGKLDQHSMVKLFRRLNDSLRTITISRIPELPNCLKELRNISDFKTEGTPLTRDYWEFLVLNQDNMRYLDFSYHHTVLGDRVRSMD